MKAPNKDTRELIRKCEAQGLQVERLGSGHFRFSKEGSTETVVVSGTALGPRSWKANRCRLRRTFGVEV